MFMRKVACFLCLQCLCAAAGMLVRFGRIACAARQQCLLPAETWLFVTENRFHTLFGVLFLYFLCKYFAIALCFCQLRIFAFGTTANLGIGPEKRILKGLEKQSVKM